MYTDAVRSYPKIIEQAYKTHNRRVETVGDYTLDNTLGDQYHCVYINVKEQKAIVAIAGTQLKGTKKRAIDDLLTDLAVFVGFEKRTTRYKKAENFLRKVMAKYPGYTITVVGHSLGALIASDLGRKYDLEVHAYSPANNATLKLTEKIKHQKQYDDAVKKAHSKQHYYVAKGDPIAAMSVLDALDGVNVNVIEAPSKKHSVHSLHQFFD